MSLEMRNVGRRVIQKSSPVLFAITMGTGAISILFYSFPYGHATQPMLLLCLVFFFLNLLLFVIFTALNVVHYQYHQGAWGSLLSHPVSSMYSGCFPMAATTLINVSVDVIHGHYHFGGEGFLYFVWGIWWLDVAVSFLCCWGVVHLMKTRQKHSLDAMSAGWLLPVVTLTVAASSGGVLARALQNYSAFHALLTLAFSVFMVMTGLTLALMILTVYLLRLIVHGLPQGGAVMSSFLPLGPTAQSAFAILLIGQNFESLLPYRSSPANSQFLSSQLTCDVLYVVCTCISFLLWSLASMWILFALLAVQHVVRKAHIPFRVTFWGLVFPNGVYANLTIQLSVVFDSPFFRVLGAAYAVVTLMLWLYVTTRSLAHFKTAILSSISSMEDVENSRSTLPDDEKGPERLEGHELSAATSLTHIT